MPMNRPPISSPSGSMNFPGARVTSSAKSMTTCHSSMRSIVFFAAASIPFPRKILKPVHQSHEGSGKSQ